jgi:hypothetical protein
MRRPDATRKTNEVTLMHDRGAMRLITVPFLKKMTRFGANRATANARFCVQSDGIL